MKARGTTRSGTAARFTLVVGAVAVERLAELVVARRNAAWSRAHGGRETGQGHYPVMVALHTGLLAGSVVEAWWRRPAYVPALGRTMLGVVAASEALRWWCIATLGPRWNTRVIVVPGLRPVTAGPYRWLRHPNYVAVVAEGVALPLVGSAWITAALFTAADAVLLGMRIRVEDAALRTLSGPAERDPR